VFIAVCGLFEVFTVTQHRLWHENRTMDGEEYRKKRKLASARQKRWRTRVRFAKGLRSESENSSSDENGEPVQGGFVLIGAAAEVEAAGIESADENSGGDTDDGRSSSSSNRSEFSDSEQNVIDDGDGSGGQSDGEVDAELNVGNVQDVEVISDAEEEGDLDDGVRKHSLLWLFMKHSELTREAKDDIIATMKAESCGCLKAMNKDSRSHEPKINVKSVPVVYSPDRTNACAHFGLQKTLLHLLRGVPGADIPNAEVEIALHVDGVQKFKAPSRSAEFWPISVRVVNVRGVGGEVATVGIHYGKKPDPVRYLHDFFCDLDEIRNKNHLRLGDGTLVSVKLERIIADSPARALLKSIKAHNSTNACERCECSGRKEGKGPMVFPARLDGQTLRTDASFRAGTQQHHHKVVYDRDRRERLRVSSVFEVKCDNVDMINDFIIDSMHTCYLCVGKRFMNFLCAHQKVRPKLSLRDERLEDLSALHQSYKRYVPTEFQRKETRSLTKFDESKATEVRMFFLYTGPVLFVDNVNAHIEVMFLMYHAALRILSDAYLCLNDEMMKSAEGLLKRFVHLCEQNFGKVFIVYTVHNLLHIIDDVRRAGVPLDEISAFISENSYRHEMKLIHTGYRPVEQYVKATLKRRKYAKSTFPGGLRQKEAEKKITTFRAERDEELQNRLDGRKWGVCNHLGLQFNCDNEKDSYCEVEQVGAEGGMEIVRVKLDHFVKLNIADDCSEDYCEGRYLDMAPAGEELYKTPVVASRIGICLDKGIRQLRGMWPLSKIRRKLFRLPRNRVDPANERFVTMPLIHSRVMRA
jgi:DNA-binding transcriptional MerR regulator